MHYPMQHGRAPLHRGHLRHVGFGPDEKLSVVRTGGQFLTGGILGFIHGRMGGMPEWKKIPLDFAVFAFSKLLRFLPWTPRWAQTALDITGDAAATYFGGSLGVMLGQKQRAKAGLLTGAPPTNRPITQGVHTPHDVRSTRFSPDVLRQAVAGRA